jgi:hypothetical protein
MSEKGGKDAIGSPLKKKIFDLIIPYWSVTDKSQIVDFHWKYA